jgi:protein-S-isoprenylcysteine O-methyltransferase Ste14
MHVRLTLVEEINMLNFVPFVSLLVIFTASLIRGVKIKRATGEYAWAFLSAHGQQRLAGLAFAASLTTLAVISAVTGINENGVFPFVAAIISTTGAAIVVIAQIQMGRAWRIGVREGDAPEFIQHGLFRFSRNPIFVGMMMIGIAIAMNSGVWYVWALWIAFIASCQVQVRIEEAHLERSFGIQYHVFCSSVPRWIGCGSAREVIG